MAGPQNQERFALRRRGIRRDGTAGGPYAALSRVVLAKARTHMWTAPVAQELCGTVRIAVIHMSGLFDAIV
ncbi:hypothetical protein AC628_27495, partial [Bradyrhizobium sp. NAS96.2]